MLAAHAWHVPPIQYKTCHIKTRIVDHSDWKLKASHWPPLPATNSHELPRRFRTYTGSSLAPLDFTTSSASIGLDQNKFVEMAAGMFVAYASRVVPGLHHTTYSTPRDVRSPTLSLDWL